LIRHGETTSNLSHVIDTAAPGASLSAAGRAQAEALAERLKDEPIESVWVSDLVRTQETAAPLAAAKGLTPVVRPGLKEIQAGDFEGGDWRPYVEVITAWAEDPSVKMPGAESGFEFFARFAAVIDEIAASGADCAAVVSHGAALRIWLAGALGQRLPVGRADPWFFANTAHVVLENSSGQWRPERWTADYITG
jgi:probable phosphoglycerate mutase